MSKKAAQVPVRVRPGTSRCIKAVSRTQRRRDAVLVLSITSVPLGLMAAFGGMVLAAIPSLLVFVLGVATLTASLKATPPLSSRSRSRMNEYDALHREIVALVQAGAAEWGEVAPQLEVAHARMLEACYAESGAARAIIAQANLRTEVSSTSLHTLVGNVSAGTRALLAHEIAEGLRGDEQSAKALKDARALARGYREELVRLRAGLEPGDTRPVESGLEGAIGELEARRLGYELMAKRAQTEVHSLTQICSDTRAVGWSASTQH